MTDNTGIFRRTYGVEIEFIGRPGTTRENLATEITNAGVQCKAQPLNHTTPRGFWKLVTDGSLRDVYGWELVSPPLDGDGGFQEIETVCSVLARYGARITRDCGLHVHADARRPLMDLDAIKRLAITYIENEAIIDSGQPPSRRGSGSAFLQSIAMRDPRTVMRANDVESIATYLRFGSMRYRYPSHGHYDPRRYVKLNFVAFWKQGTVEFRHFAGTIDAAKIRNNVLLSLAMMEKAATTTNQAAVADAQHTQRIARRVRQGTKRAIVYDMLLRPEGCTTAEVLAATGWREVSVAGIAHQYGIRVRTERTWENHRRVYRYFGTLDPNATVTVTSRRAASFASFKAANIEELANYLGLSDKEREFWTSRATMFGQPVLSGIVRQE